MINGWIIKETKEGDVGRIKERKKEREREREREREKEREKERKREIMLGDCELITKGKKKLLPALESGYKQTDHICFCDKTKNSVKCEVIAAVKHT